MKLEPKYKHDCDRCQLFASTAKGDWYVCEGANGRSVTLRTGDEPATYASTPVEGYVYRTPLLAAALASGLRLTDQEVREMLAHALLSDMSLDFYALLDDSIDKGGEAVRKAVLERPSSGSVSQKKAMKRLRFVMTELSKLSVETRHSISKEVDAMVASSVRSVMEQEVVSDRQTGLVCLLSIADTRVFEEDS